MPVLNEFDLTGRVALVTGAGRGIAAAIAEVLAEAGAAVAINALTPMYVQPLARNIGERTGRNVRTYVADLTKTEDVNAMVDSVLADYGRIDALINGIGDAIPHPLVALPGSAGPAEDLSDEDLKRVMDINLTGILLTTRTVGKHMLERRSGKVISISSFASLRGGRDMIIYAAAKAGLNGFTRAVALEWAPYNVQVNAIAPGMFPDPVTFGDERVRQFQEQAKTTVPLGRVGDRREVGYLAVYLASKASDYMTGQTIYLDGGSTL
jgi:2-deoxy-D-gluconate 3-dehydrogenase